MLLFLALQASDAPPQCAANSCPLRKPAAPRYELGPVNFIETIDLSNGLKAAAKDSTPAITVVIDSPGGSVGTMFELIDLAKVARKGGTVITCRVDGMAASAAAIFLEAACDVRTMTPGSQLLFHEPATQVRGKEGDFIRTANDLADTNRRVACMIAWRLKMTADQYTAWLRDRDRWMDTAEALERGAIDRVEPSPVTP